MRASANGAAAYVCRDFACLAPVRSGVKKEAAPYLWLSASYGYFTEKIPILPIPSIADSVNQMFPSGPVVMPTGCARGVGTA